MLDASQLQTLAKKARATGDAVDFLLKETGSTLLRQPQLPPDLSDALTLLRTVFAGCADVIFREFTVGRAQPVRVALVFVDGLTNHEIIHEQIMKPLMFQAGLDGLTGRSDLRQAVKDLAVSVGEVKEAEKPEELAIAVLSGDAAVLFDGHAKALLVAAHGWDKRSIEKPEHKAVTKGPKDAFTETLRVNTALLRRRLRDPQVKVRSLRIGRVTQTDVAVVYHQRIADPRLVAEVSRRVEAVEIDGVVDSGILEQLISESPQGIFPTVQESERPDEVTAAILDGRVAILVDNTPFALVVPATLNNLMMVPEDYYMRWPIASFLRVVRYAAALLSLTLPAIYVGLTSFRPEVIPIELGIFIAGSREGRPFPVMGEVLLMELAMEMLREATIRLPGAFGQAISVVGTLVVGQAAVRAGLVSAVIIIITGATAVASFAIPSMTLGLTIRLLRFPLILITGVYGLTGLIMGLYIILVRMAGLRSFGLEYLAPFGPLYWPDLKDAIVRLPLKFLRRRPQEYHPRDVFRQPDGRGK